MNKGTKQRREVLVRTVPICGSRNYSRKFSKDFGYKISPISLGLASVLPVLQENNKAMVGHVGLCITMIEVILLLYRCSIQRMLLWSDKKPSYWAVLKPKEGN